LLLLEEGIYVPLHAYMDLVFQGILVSVRAMEHGLVNAAKFLNVAILEDVELESVLRLTIAIVQLLDGQETIAKLLFANQYVDMEETALE